MKQGIIEPRDSPNKEAFFWWGKGLWETMSLMAEIFREMSDIMEARGSEQFNVKQ